MFDITVPDAIAFGSLCIAFVVAYLGTQRGKSERTRNPPDPAVALLGASLVDTATVRDLAEAVKLLVVAVNAATAAREQRLEAHRHQEALEALARLLRPPVRRRTRKTR